jgi:hypothetical protein
MEDLEEMKKEWAEEHGTEERRSVTAEREEALMAKKQQQVWWGKFHSPEGRAVFCSDFLAQSRVGMTGSVVGELGLKLMVQTALAYMTYLMPHLKKANSEVGAFVILVSPNKAREFMMARGTRPKVTAETMLRLARFALTRIPMDRLNERLMVQSVFTTLESMKTAAARGVQRKNVTSMENQIPSLEAAGKIKPLAMMQYQVLGWARKFWAAQRINVRDITRGNRRARRLSPRVRVILSALLHTVVCFEAQPVRNVNMLGVTEEEAETWMKDPRATLTKAQGKGSVLNKITTLMAGPQATFLLREQMNLIKPALVCGGQARRGKPNVTDEELERAHNHITEGDAETWLRGWAQGQRKRQRRNPTNASPYRWKGIFDAARVADKNVTSEEFRRAYNESIYNKQLVVGANGCAFADTGAGFKKIVQEATGVKGFTVTMLRKLTSTTLKAEGCDPAVVDRWLEHTAKVAGLHYDLQDRRPLMMQMQGAYGDRRYPQDGEPFVYKQDEREEREEEGTGEEEEEEVEEEEEEEESDEERDEEKMSEDQEEEGDEGEESDESETGARQQMATTAGPSDEFYAQLKQHMVEEEKEEDEIELDQDGGEGEEEGDESEVAGEGEGVAQQDEAARTTNERWADSSSNSRPRHRHSHSASPQECKGAGKGQEADTETEEESTDSGSSTYKRLAYKRLSHIRASGKLRAERQLPKKEEETEEEESEESEMEQEGGEGDEGEEEGDENDGYVHRQRHHRDRRSMSPQGREGGEEGEEDTETEEDDESEREEGGAPTLTLAKWRHTISRAPQHPPVKAQHYIRSPQNHIRTGYHGPQDVSGARPHRSASNGTNSNSRNSMSSKNNNGRSSSQSREAPGQQEAASVAPPLATGRTVEPTDLVAFANAVDAQQPSPRKSWTGFLKANPEWREEGGPGGSSAVNRVRDLYRRGCKARQKVTDATDGGQ